MDHDRSRAPSRIVAVGIGLIGGVAVFLWALHAVREGVWWQVGLAAAVWAGHAWLVARMWRAGA